MSIDGRGPSLNRAADNTIAALKSKNSRLEERLAVVEGVARANADDRDSYMERCVELEGERDRARATAVALEQDGAMSHHALVILADAVLAEVDHNTTVYSKALAVQRIAGGSS